MGDGFLVTAAFFRRELARALVQLHGHLIGLGRGAAEGDEYLGQLGDFHDRI